MTACANGLRLNNVEIEFFEDFVQQADFAR